MSIDSGYIGINEIAVPPREQWPSGLGVFRDRKASGQESGRW